MKFKDFPHHRLHTVKNKPFEVYWSSSAEKALQKRLAPLLVEMELKFACMVRMRVHFHENVEHKQSISITDKLSVLYRPVVGQSCSLKDSNELAGHGELTTGSMANRFPKRLAIDYVRGAWFGQYS
jgi:hypothetical protein